MQSSWREARTSVGPALRPLAICVLGVALSTADQSLFSYAIPEITREFAIDLSVIGQLLSVSFLVASFTVVLSGVASDEFGRKRVFIALLCVSALFVGAQAFATSLGSLAILRVLSFAIGVGIYPITNIIVAESAPPRFRGLLSGLLQMGYPLGFAFASVIAGLTIELHGWRFIFLPAFAVVLLAPFLGRLLPEQEIFKKASSESTHTSVGQRPLLGRLARLVEPQYRKRFVVCFIGSFLISLAVGGTTYFLPTYLVQAHEIDVGRASAIAGASYAIGAAGYLAAAICGEFITTRRNTTIAWVWLGAVAFAATLWLAQSPLALTVGLGVSILFIYGSEAVRAVLIAELFPTSIRATAMATTGSLAVTIAWLLAPLMISYLSQDLGWALTFTLCAVIPLVLGGLTLLQLVNLKSGLSIEETSQPDSALPQISQRVQY